MKSGDLVRFKKYRAGGEKPNPAHGHFGIIIDSRPMYPRGLQSEEHVVTVLFADWGHTQKFSEYDLELVRSSRPKSRL